VGAQAHTNIAAIAATTVPDTAFIASLSIIRAQWPTERDVTS
jgi:hypothetical protein